MSDHHEDVQLLLEANAGLREDIVCLTEKLDEVTVRADRTRNVVHGLIYVLTVAVVAGVLVWLYDRSADNRELIVKDNAAQVADCELTNDIRRAQKDIWDTVLLEDKELADQKKGYTKAEEAAIDRIRVKIAEATQFADCEAIDNGH